MLVLVFIRKPIFDVKCFCCIWDLIFGVGVFVVYVFRYWLLVLVSDVDIDIWCWCLCRICKSIFSVGVFVAYG